VMLERLKRATLVQYRLMAAESAHADESEALAEMAAELSQWRPV